jgi:hypothetical protein
MADIGIAIVSSQILMENGVFPAYKELFGEASKTGKCMY